MTRHLKAVAYEYKGKLFHLEDDAIKLNPIYCFVRQSDALAVISELERDIDQLASDRDIEKQLHREWRGKFKLLEAENARLREDKERLAFLLRNMSGSQLRSIVGVLADTSDLDEFRDAIDAAMDMHKNQPKIDTSPERD